MGDPAESPAASACPAADGAGSSTVMPRLSLECARCGHSFIAALDLLTCPVCGDGFVLVNTGLWREPEGSRRSIWVYRQAMPGVPESCQVSLGEGGTPLVRISGTPEVWIKDEGANPTHSYKDRFNAVNVSVAKVFGARGVALISTGNAGVSASAYCVAAGLDARVVCDVDVAASIVDEIRRHGGHVIRGADDDAKRAALIAALDEGFLPGSRSVPAVGVTPFGCVGYRTIAYEIVDQLGRAPSAVALPVGGGDGIFGVFQGFAELVRSGVITVSPRLIGARTTSRFAPSIAFDEVSIHAVAVVESTGGEFVHVSESQMRAALLRLDEAGISAEPASATAFAAARGVEDAVCVITGGGARWRHSRAAIDTSAGSPC